jgi:thimet oligopeptidase
MQAEIQGLLDACQGYLDQVTSVEGPRTVENTLGPLNELAIHLDEASSKASLMENVHPDQMVREAAEKASQQVSAFATALSLNRDVYDALAALDVSGEDPLVQRLVEHSLRDYRRSGVDKDEATRKQIEALRKELVEIGQEFDRNIRDGRRHILLDSVDDLAGMPQDYIDRHPPGDDGKIKITTDYPDYYPFLKYARNGEARRKLYMEFLNRAYPDNKETFGRLLAKRYELARMLGYDSWAHYVTEDKMSKSPEKVAAFLQRLDEVSRNRAEQDYALLLARKQQDDPAATTVEDYEKTYYGELVKAEQYDFDSQALRAYFDYPLVKQGIFDLTATLFGVTLKKIEDAPVWHESVEHYELYEGDRLIGRFYLDMHPREGKYGHAAQFGVRPGIKGRQVPEAALVCNFPEGDGDGPALMEHSDVETFLHEFGHLLHTMFGGHQEWAYFTGIATEWDFVEAPSQMLEEWSIDVPTLQTFAKHYETGEPIPAEMVHRLKAAQNYGKGLNVRQQNFYSSISLHAYNQEPSQVDMDALVPELQKTYSSFDYVPGTHMYASFGHLEGYSAMYYTYMWSLVIAKDLFSRFDPNNMLDTSVSMEYRRSVLDPGGTKDASDLVRDFLGREYGFESFREWMNEGVNP